MVKLLRVLAAMVLVLGGAGSAFAEQLNYEVTITNITKGQTFTPQLVATHGARVALFELGSPASAGLELLAEAGDTSLATDELLTDPDEIGEVQTIPGLLGPGESISTVIAGGGRHGFLSLAAMLIPTNDTFVALNGIRLPRRGATVSMALGYDAGTEFNDQSCANMPGPRCAAFEPVAYDPEPGDNDEGHVYVSNGFHELPAAAPGEADVLGPHVYDWRNPVARVVVRRLHD